jgi:hypothetical protein
MRPTAHLERLHDTGEQGPEKCFHTACFKRLAWLRDTQNPELRGLLSELPKFLPRSVTA